MSEVDLTKYFKQIIGQISNLFIQNKLFPVILFNNIENLSLESLLVEIVAILLKQKKHNDLHKLPDVLYIQSYGQQIKVDQIKNILEKIYLTGYVTGVKIVIISSVELLNKSASNALLKVLEDPPEKTYFLMTSNQLHAIKQTLRSRVQVFNIVLNFEQKKDYLRQKYQMNEDSITKALQITKNNLSIINRIKLDKDFWKLRKTLMKVLHGKLSPLVFSNNVNLDKSYQDVLYWMLMLLIDAYYYKLGICSSELIKDQKSLIKRLADRHSISVLYKHYHKLLKLKSYDHEHFNINKQLAIESLLIEMCI